MVNQKDLEILEILKANCKLPSREISKLTGLPITTIHNRIKKMEKDGIIKAYVANIDNAKIGKNVQAFIQIRLKHSSPDSAANKLVRMHEIDEVYVISGTMDIMIKVATKDIDSLQYFLDKIDKIENIERTTTSVVLKKFEKTGFKLLNVT